MQSERYTHMCVRGLQHQGPLKNPSVTHFVFLKTHYFIILSPLFYHLFLTIMTLLTIEGYQSHCIRQRHSTPMCCHSLGRMSVRLVVPVETFNVAWTLLKV